MEFLKNWVIQISYISILYIVLELLIPDSSLKKYAKVVIGLVIMVAIINPVISFVKGGINFDAMVFKTSYSLNNIDVNSLSKQAEKERNVMISEEYKKRLSEQIQNKILNFYNIENIVVNIDIVEDIKSKDFGKIKKLILSFKNAKYSSKNTDNINKVNIDTSKDKISFINYEDIKKTISTFYNIPLKNITIEEK